MIALLHNHRITSLGVDWKLIIRYCDYLSQLLALVASITVHVNIIVKIGNTTNQALPLEQWIYVIFHYN